MIREDARERLAGSALAPAGAAMSEGRRTSRLRTAVSGSARAAAVVPGASAAGLSAAVLVTGLCVGATAAHAVDGTWTGATSEWTTGGNWSSTPAVPDGTATFTNNGAPTAVTISGNPTIQTIQFDAGAPAYSFTIGGSTLLSIVGTGIDNNASSAPSFTNNSVILFHNASTAGNATITTNDGLGFFDSSRAGNATITNNRTLQFSGTSTADSAAITNNSSLIFLDSTTAGNATITNNWILKFDHFSTASSATITNNGGLDFVSISTAGRAAITNYNLLRFLDDSTAGTATITTNNGGTTFFAGNSTGELARLITNSGGSVDISSLGVAGMTAGSIEGAGTYFLGSNELTVGGNNLSTEVSGVIQGGSILGGGVGGSLVKVGVGTLTLSGINTYTGATTVNGGTLRVNGDITSSSGVTVNAGATLGGTGTVGSTVIANGGTLSPGNSIGPLTVNGNLVLSTAATYLVEVNAAGQSDRTNVTGTAQLAGTVQVVAAPGRYAPGITYTVLTAGGGVSGTFDGLVTNLGATAFLNPTLSYDANNVFFSWAKVASLASAGQTRNQIATGGAVDALPFGNPIVDTLLAGTAAQARTAFDRLSGEVHASAAGVMLGQSHDVRDAVIGRARQSYGGAAGSALAALGTAGPAVAYVQDVAQVGAQVLAAFDGVGGQRPLNSALPAAPTPNERVLAAWSQAIGAWGRAGGDGNAAALDSTAAGFLTGFDATFAGAWRLGVAGGYTRSSVRVDVRASSASMDNFHIALYGGTQQGPWGLRGGAAFTWHEVDTSRTIAFPGFFDATKARYDARTAQIFGEAGYSVLVGKTALEPFAAAAYVNLDTDRFRETGGAAALTGGTTLDTAFTTLGLRAASVLGFAGGMAVTGRSTLGWRHAFGDVTPAMSLAFASGGIPFTIAGAPLARDNAVVEASLALDVTANARLGIGYSGQIADTAQDHAVKGSFLWRF